VSERRLILASASQSRGRLLTAAGLTFEAIPAHVDEDAVKAAMKAEGATVTACAETLAELKALKVSQQHPEALVIGADQMLECAGTWFDKPPTMAAAHAQLMALSGKTHTLPTAAVVATGGARIWHHISTPRLTMRAFDDAFIKAYLEGAGERVLQSVGAYQLEGLGVNLFQAVTGDFFTILGLPLLPLLDFLRGHKVAMS
jgi:septum formation protein